MSEQHDPVRLSRRAALGAAAAAGAAATASGRALAAATSSDVAPTPTGPADDPSFVGDMVDTAGGSDVPEIAPAPTLPGTRYVSLAGIDFKPKGNGAVHESTTGELQTQTDIGFSAPVVLPHGARITEMVVYAIKPSVSGATVRLVCHRSSLAGDGAFVVVASIDTNSLPASPSGRALTAAVPAGTNGAIVDTGAAAYFVLVNPLPATPPNELWGVRIGFVGPDAGRFFPLDPYRAYDSRAAAPEPGMLAPNWNRVILVKDSRANGTGAVLASDVVPAGATAIACNLTVTGTTGPNFLALTPGDAASFTASAINWSGPDQSVANGLIVKLDANRFAKVWCGDQTGSTHVILDVSGYWL